MILLHNVTKRYPLHGSEHTVLDRVNLTVHRGERMGILGRNGSGKSTLVRLISGVEPPTEGSIRRDMRVSWPLAFSGGFQGHLTGLDNLRFVCRIYDVPFEDKLDYVEDFSELGKYMREPVRLYSSGMRARLAFALSMVIDFDCYLIDEVVAVGDARFRDKCQTELFQKRGHKSMIIVSHEPNFIKKHCQDTAVIVKGKLRTFANVSEGFDYYAKHAKEQ